MQNTCPDSERLLESLRDGDSYPHAADNVQRLETHISWLFLAGDYAYKLKRPVDFGFIDYSSLERRRHFCHEELRLNGRTAPELYLQVVAIHWRKGRPYLEPDDGKGPADACEYAVQMRRFPDDALLSIRLAESRLEAGTLDELARLLAGFHQRCTAAPADSDFGTPAALMEPVRQNFLQVGDLPLSGEQRKRLERIERWSEDRYAALKPFFAERRRQGFVRECHGDLHLGNIVLWHGRPTPFDGIEFNPNLRYIDIQSEMAFLTMDLEKRGHPELAWRLLNHYLFWSGDYAGLACMRFYQCYRAMVRAKVSGLRLGQRGLSEREEQQARSDLDDYLALALSYTQKPSPRLILTHGLSGSGKSYLAAELSSRLGYVWLRSDVERKRLFGLSMDASSKSAVDSGIYTPEAGRRTYEHLLQLSERLIQDGLSVIVDATFLKEQQRTPFHELAEKPGIPFILLHAEAPVETLYQRVEERMRHSTDPSEADRAVLDKQLEHYEPLSDAELKVCVKVDTTGAIDWPSLMEAIAQRS